MADAVSPSHKRVNDNDIFDAIEGAAADDSTSWLHADSSDLIAGVYRIVKLLTVDDAGKAERLVRFRVLTARLQSHSSRSFFLLGNAQFESQFGDESFAIPVSLLPANLKQVCLSSYTMSLLAPAGLEATILEANEHGSQWNACHCRVVFADCS